jgi:hypothetical protein
MGGNKPATFLPPPPTFPPILHPFPPMPHPCTCTTLSPYAAMRWDGGNMRRRQIRIRSPTDHSGDRLGRFRLFFGPTSQNGLPCRLRAFLGAHILSPRLPALFPKRNCIFVFHAAILYVAVCRVKHFSLDFIRSGTYYKDIMNKLNKDKQAQVIAALVESTSINATVRMTGVTKNTILKLLADLGNACAEYQDKALRNLKCKRIQCDEIWQFC